MNEVQEAEQWFWDKVVLGLIQSARGSGLTKPAQVATWAGEILDLRRKVFEQCQSKSV